MAKLNERQVKEIIERQQETDISLAWEFGVSWCTVWEIRNNKTWKHLPRPSVTKDRRKKLTPDQVREIRRKHAESGSLSSIAREYGINATTVNLIVRRIRWPDVA